MALIASILSKFDDSGVKKAKHSFEGFKHSLSSFGIPTSIKDIADTLLEAAKAASVEQKSTQLLNNQLMKNAHATKGQTLQNNKFIQSLSLQTGIVKNQLRPAQAKLARATGSVAESQKLLRIALDASTVSGKPLETVALALSKAYNGNTGALARMFPELKKSKDAIGDLNKEVKGAAAEQADPFMKFNNAMDIMKENLGNLILPMINDFITYISKPGGLVDQVNKFFEDVGNPKTDVGKTFEQIKKAVKDTIKGVGDFFALFGGGDAMKGFGNVASNLVKMLPALLALKGILALASAGKSIASLAKAIGLIRGTSAITGNGSPSVVPTGTPGKVAAKPSLGVLKAAGFFAIGAEALMVGADMMNDAARTRWMKEGIDYDALQASGMSTQILRGPKGVAWAKKNFPLKKFAKGGIVMPRPGGTPIIAGEAGFAEAIVPLNRGMGMGNNITINVNSADPKAVVDAVSKYLAQNGGKMPSKWGR